MPRRSPIEPARALTQRARDFVDRAKIRAARTTGLQLAPEIRGVGRHLAELIPELSGIAVVSAWTRVAARGPACESAAEVAVAKTHLAVSALALALLTTLALTALTLLALLPLTLALSLALP